MEYQIRWKNEIPALLLLGAAFTVTAVFYTRMPDPIPMHWNLQGEVDSWVGKTPLSAAAIPLVALTVWLGMTFLPLLDPRQERYAKFQKAYGTIKLALVALLVYLQGLIVAFGLGVTISMDKAVPAAVSLLFIILGNVMGKIRQNYFVGFRSPWTIHSERVWNRTHRLAGRLMVLAGFTGLAGCLFRGPVTFTLLLGPLGIAVIIPFVYAAVLYKREEKEKSKNGLDR